MKGRYIMKINVPLDVKIFADSANIDDMLAMYQYDCIKGFTTNPTLMRKSNVVNYDQFVRDILSYIPDRPISFSVMSDTFPEMRKQALRIASLGTNVYVKIPITNTQGESSAKLIRELANEGVRQNITAVMTVEQVDVAAAALANGPEAAISIFAGRIADTGCCPIPLMRLALQRLTAYSNIELIWASPRELLNIMQANEIGCHIITVSSDLLKKLPLLGKNLTDYSLETVRMFHSDAFKAGYTVERDIA